ncbi:unnamed protein product [Ectocarpus sp. 6 AP-2014]
MEAFMVLLPAFCALSGASAVSPCLDPTDVDYSCEVDEDGNLSLYNLGITDEDVDGGDLASCLDNAGRELVVQLYLHSNALTTLPEGIFEGLTALVSLGWFNHQCTRASSVHIGGLVAAWRVVLLIFPGLLRCLVCSVGPLTYTGRWLSSNALTTLPEGIFEGLTALDNLLLSSNALITLPEGILEGLTVLEYLWLSSNALTTLPEGIFEGLTALELLSLSSNALTTLPAGIFEGLTVLKSLGWFNHQCTRASSVHIGGLVVACRAVLLIFPGLLRCLVCSVGPLTYTGRALSSNALTTLPAGIFEGLTVLKSLYLFHNALTTLPEGIFEGLTALERLRLEGNELECLPTSILVEVDDDASSLADGLHVDFYGDECGCSVANVTDNVCDEEACTPGPVGYTCAAVLTPAPLPAVTAAPVAATAAPVAATAAPVAATAAPVAVTAAPAESGETPATSPIPTPSPSLGVTSTTSPVTTSSPEQTSTSDSTPIVVGIVSAVAAAALIALAVFLRRRRASRQKMTKASAAPPTHDDGNVEEQPPDVLPPPYSAVVVAGNGDDMAPSHQDNASLPRKALTTEADGVDREGVVPLQAASALDGEVEASAEHAAKDCRARLASAGSAEKVPAATTSTANLSTAERDELSQFQQRARSGCRAGLRRTQTRRSLQQRPWSLLRP